MLKPCAICKIEFESRSRKSYCSDVCLQEGTRIRRRIAYRTHGSKRVWDFDVGEDRLLSRLIQFHPERIFVEEEKT
jgi:hypothetical protein